MKRPLAVLAAGFVLGEVLVLQDYRVVDINVLPWLCAAAAGALCLRLRHIRGGRCHGREGGRGSGREGGHCTGREGGQGRSSLGQRDLGQRGLLLFLSCLLAGCVLGSTRTHKEQKILDREEALAGELAGLGLKVKGRISRLERKKDQVVLTLDDAVAETGNKTSEFRRILVYMEEDAGRNRGGEAGQEASADLAVGLEVVVRGSLEPVEGPRNPGEFDFRTYYRSKGTACRMFGEKFHAAGGEPVPYDRAVEGFRSWCGNVLDRVCLPEDAAVFRAVLLGDSSAMDPGVREMYQRNGISHLLAVSGQHLAIVGGGIYLILRRVGLGYGKAGALSAFLVISYGILTGSSGSAVRAVIMIICLWLAAVKGRSYDTISALGLAALFLLGREPYLLYHSGFQLSFGAVLAIGGLGGWLRRVLGVRCAWEQTLLISLCVQICITPVVLYHYYQYPLYGIILNLLVVPLISILMYSGILGIAIGSVWLKGGMAAVGAGHYILMFYEWLCGQAERLPGYCLVMGRPGWRQIGLYGLGIGIALAGIKIWAERRKEKDEESGTKEKKEAGQPGAGEKGKRGWRSAIYLSGLFFAYAVCFLAFLPPSVKELEVVCLDVGQGDGLLLLTRDYTVLVDGGSSSQKDLGNKTLEPYLKSRGITGIDYAVVSHGDSDHINGLSYLLEESEDIKIENLILPVMGQGKEQEQEQEVYGNLALLAENRGALVSYMDVSDRIEAGALTLTCLYAGEEFTAQDRNSHSLIICGDYKGFHMLFTGDTGEAQEKQLVELAETENSIQDIHLDHVEILKTAHHGSPASSSEKFLDRVNIKLALISYGRGNTYGHPSPEVVARLKSRGAQVLETGIRGAITLRTDGTFLWIDSFLACEDEPAAVVRSSE